MRLPMPVQEPIVGFGVSGAGIQDAMSAGAPIAQAQQGMEERAKNEKKAQESANYQKLLRSGADGMRAYATEVSSLYPDLGKQIAQEAEQYATFFSDPALTGDKAEQYASNFYESANSRIKFADESAKKTREEQEKADKFKRFQSEFVPGVEPLIQQSKTKPETVSDIASQLAKSEHAGQDYAEKFIDNLKQARPTSDLASARRESLAHREEEDAYRRAIQFKDKNASSISAGTHLITVDKILKRIGLKGGIHGNAEGVNIPGFGVGAKAFRKWMQDKDAVELRNAVSWIHNGIRNQLFGAALSAHELAAFEQAAGTGQIDNEIAFLSGLQRIYDELDQRLRPIGDARTKQIISDEGILTNESLPARPKAKSKVALKAGESITTDNISDVDDDALEKRRQELLGKRGKNAPK